MGAASGEVAQTISGARTVAIQKILNTSVNKVLSVVRNCENQKKIVV